MWGASALVAVSSVSLGTLSSDQGGISALIPPPLLSVALYLIHYKVEEWATDLDFCSVFKNTHITLMQDVNLKIFF